MEANGNAAFFQVAVGLIPVLMFGGAVAELRNRPRQRPNPRPFGLALTAILAAGVIAEIIAIRGAIDPSVGDLGQRYLAFVVTTGTVGLALWIAAPLLREATVGTRVWLGLREVVAVIGLAAVIGQVAITESLDHASARAALESAGERVTKVGRELNQAERTESAARTQLLRLAQSMRSTHAMSAVILHLHQLDDRALAPVRTRGLNQANAEHRIQISFRRLNAISRSLERAFRDPIAGLSQADRELLLLAVQRLITAVAPAIDGREELAYAEAEYARACDAAAFLGCR
ncbi:MAG TPA: hypothetical protein VLK56_04415 [Solirubrobacterales bacterium]|nr:hypothetical protein [Solirubrobacterales bacterium]